MANTKLKAYQSLEELAVQIRQSDYSLDLIREHLNFNRSDITNALLIDTQEGKLEIDGRGREVWKIVLGHYRNLGLEDDLFCIEQELYERLSPFREFFLNAYASFCGGFLMALSFGTILVNPIIKKTKEKPQHKYIAKRIGLDW